MSAQHTPGPWVIVTDALGYESIVSRPEDATEDLVAHVFGDNAALLRAAPDLYEALADCVKRLRRCAENAGNAPFAVDGLCEQFEAALAKAQGQ